MTPTPHRIPRFLSHQPLSTQTPIKNDFNDRPTSADEIQASITYSRFETFEVGHEHGIRDSIFLCDTFEHVGTVGKLRYPFGTHETRSTAQFKSNKI